MRTNNAFVNQPTQPTQPTGAELATALGPAKQAWDRFLSQLAQEHDVNIHEWKCYSPQWGWSLRAKRRARTIVWLSPSEGCFTVLFILGGKAMQAARQSQWPRRIVQAMEQAPKYPEGTGLRLAVKSSRDIATLLKLAVIKLAN